jgi:hypothetical protein
MNSIIRDGEVQAEACSYNLPASRAQLHVTPGGTGQIHTEPGSRKEDMFDAVDTRASNCPDQSKLAQKWTANLDGLTCQTRSLARQIGKSAFRTS